MEENSITRPHSWIYPRFLLNVFIIRRMHSAKRLSAVWLTTQRVAMYRNSATYIDSSAGDRKSYKNACYLWRLTCTFTLQSHEPAKLIFVISNLLILACIPYRLAGNRHAEDAILVVAVPGSWFLLMFFAGWVIFSIFNSCCIVMLLVCAMCVS